MKKGGGGTEIHNPTPPAPQTVGESMADYVESLPALYEAQMAYAPQLAQQQVSLAQQYAQPYGQAIQTAQAAMNPETAALQEQMAGQASEGMEQGLSPQEREMYRDTYAANLGTNAGSGIGADYMSTGMLQQEMARKDYYRNLGLSVAQRQPLAQPQTPQTPNWMGGYQPAQAMNYNANTYGSFAQAGRPFAYGQNQSFLWGAYQG